MKNIHFFSLLEMVLAVAIFSVVATLAGSVLFSSQQIWTRISENSDRLAMLGRLDYLADRMIRNAIPFDWPDSDRLPRPFFHGEPTRVRFATQSGIYDTDDSGLRFVEIHLIDRQLQVSYSNYPLVPFEGQWISHEIFAREVTELTFQYAIREQGEIIWTEQFIDLQSGEFPVAIQMQVTFQDGKVVKYLRRTAGNSWRSSLGKFRKNTRTQAPTGAWLESPGVNSVPVESINPVLLLLWLRRTGRPARRFRRRRERGIALISTLALLALLGVLVASAVASAQFSSASTDSGCTRQKAFYQAESILNRTLQELANDRANHSDRGLGLPEPTQERFMADGSGHELIIGEQKTQVTIHDAVAGTDVSGTMPSRHLMSMYKEGMDVFPLLSEFSARLNDYVDRDDFVRNGGMEVAHYRSIGIPALPRNAPLQYREEIRWIPGSADFFPSDEYGTLQAARLIAPKGLRPLIGRPNLYAVSAAFAARLCNLTPGEQQKLGEGLTAWRKKRIPLQDSLPSSVWSKLSVYFSIRESGIYAISVGVIDGEGEVPSYHLHAVLGLGASNTPLEFYSFFVN